VRAFVEADPELAVYVAGDRDVSYQSVYEILSLLQRDAKVARAGLMGEPKP
jgi:biopolymer transport protein TolR